MVLRGGAFEWCLGQDGALMNGISTLTVRDQRACLFSCALSVSLSALCPIKIQQEDATCKPGRGPSPQPNHAGTLTSESKSPEV